MQWLVRWAVIAAVIFMVITALNISNQAVNDLTDESGDKFLAVDMQDGNLNMDFSGNSYNVNMDKLKNIELLKQDMVIITEKVEAHFTKSWRIFKVLFLS
ncbi:MAG: hypothetical protein PHD40_01865 [Syntrophomonadaceae bacterium]|nr:hypothetical protein [Syntrophomonadaceae bacterium]